MRFYLTSAAAAFTLLLATPSRAQQAETPPAAPVPPATLFKLGADALRTEVGAWGVSLPLYGGVERQLGRHWSFTADLTPNVSLSDRGPRLSRLGVALGPRYYYNQARRQRLNKTTRLLNGPYLQLQYRSEFRGYYGGAYYGTPGQRYYRHLPSLDALWGYQHQVGRYGFFDLGAGLGLRHDEPYLGEALRLPDDTAWGLTLTLRARVGVAF